MFRVLAAIAVLGLVGCSSPSTDPPARSEPSARASLTAGDREALRALDQSYGKAWREKGAKAQSEALLALFARDAVVYPGSGAPPISGTQALHDFWFPDGLPSTEVEYFERHADAIEGSPALAAISGRSEIAFTYDGTRSVQEGHYIIHARPDEAGYWKIERMMWNSRQVE